MRGNIMICITIVEDCQEEREHLNELLQQYSLDNNVVFEINEFESGESLLQSDISERHIIFMDIELGGMNGIQTAAKIRENDKDVIIVIITNLIQYAIQGYSIQAADFILKPLDHETFNHKMDEWIQLHKSKIKSIILNSGNGMKKYVISKIHYIEVYGHKLVIHTDKGSEEITGTLKKMEEQLGIYGFVRCNKCYLVNLAYVDSIVDDSVEVGSEFLKISRREKKKFINAFTHFVRG